MKTNTPEDLLPSPLIYNASGTKIVKTTSQIVAKTVLPVSMPWSLYY